MVLRAASLCAGIGGLDLALHGVARTICYVEREAYAAAILAARMEEGGLAPAPIWSDLRSFDARPWRGCVDLVMAGFPCQPFSCAGSRKSTSDDRYLWPELARIIGECQPELVFLENVPGLITADGPLGGESLDDSPVELVRGGAFGQILSDLAGLGFDAEWASLRASDVGAPHRRERLFVLAHRPSRRFGVAGEPSGSDGQFDGIDAPVADSDGGRFGGIGLRGLLDRERSASGDDFDARGGSGGLADSDRRGRDWLHERVEPGHLATDFGGKSEGTQAGTTPWPPGPEDDDMGDADWPRLEGRSRCRGERRDELGPWPPGPTDALGWRDYLRWWPGTEPAVRRGADGFSCRVERLRALGNAVVPDQARAAWEELMSRVETQVAPSGVTDGR